MPLCQECGSEQNQQLVCKECYEEMTTRLNAHIHKLHMEILDLKTTVSFLELTRNPVLKAGEVDNSPDPDKIAEIHNLFYKDQQP